MSSGRLHVICGLVRDPSVFLLQDKTSFKHLQIKFLSKMKLFNTEDDKLNFEKRLL